MPRIKGLTEQQREQQATEAELARTSQAFLTILGEARGRSEMTYDQMAELIGTHPNTLRKWRKGKLPEAEFGKVISAAQKLGYRIEFVPQSKKAS